uniref:Uncharacterized protein n=1 Tax=viral metagenome TaxID=1070528 RepID=A0A6H1ZPZ4_9ZZZZ
MAKYQDDEDKSYPKEFLHLIIWTLALSVVITLLIWIFSGPAKAFDPWSKGQIVDILI